MVQLHFDRNAVTCKIVYYGPGLSGKTTNLEIIHQKAPQDSRGDMVSIATRGDRTLYFDYLPLELGQVQGMDTTFQLYTVPGQIYYNNTRKLVLQGVDGIVFVADSSSTKVEENRESFRNVIENLQTIGLSINDIPVVIQYNKRDLPDALPINELDAQLNTKRFTTFEAVAKDGQGVFVTLKEIGRQVIERINTNQSEPRRRTGNTVPKEIANRSSAQLPSPAPNPATATTPLTSATTPMASAQRTTPVPVSTSLPQPQGMRAPGQQTPQAGSPQPPSSFQRSAAQHAPTKPANQTQSPTRQMNQRKTSKSSSTQRPVSPKQRHLNKEKPPSLTQRRTQQLEDMNDLGSTEPHLKKYKNQDGTGGSKFFRFVIGAFLAFITIVIISAVLVLFVPDFNKAVAPHLPPAIQELINLDGQTETTTTTEPSEVVTEQSDAPETPEATDATTPNNTDSE